MTNGAMSPAWAPQMVMPSQQATDERAATIEVAKQLYQISCTLAEILKALDKMNR